MAVYIFCLLRMCRFISYEWGPLHAAGGTMGQAQEGF